MDPLVVASHRGGLNEDPPNALQADECVTATNVEWWDSMLGERRGGTSSLSLTSSGLTSETEIGHLSQWFPTNSPTLPEYIAGAITPSTTVSFARRDTSGTWHVLTPDDAVDTGLAAFLGIRTQPLNAVLFIACKTGQNRLHVWDGTNWRRAGIAAPVAPTAADQAGTGLFSGTRYYRQRAITKSGSTVVLRSEPSAVLTFTPPGTAPGATITKGANASGESSTHWELEASLDNANFYLIATTVNATTTYTDITSGPKTYPAVTTAAPTSTDGTSVTYVLLSNQAAQLNLTGTVSNGVYSDNTTIAGRGWIGYDATSTYIPLTPTLAWAADQNWYASPDVATALEIASAGGTGQDYADVGTLSEAIGAYLTIPAAQFLAVDGNRLIYAGHQTDASLKSTVGWTPTTADPGVGSAERAPIVTTGGTPIVTTQDLDNYDGGPLTGIAASTFGTWFAFKWQRIYSAIRSQDATNAYNINTINTSRGALPGSVIKASDAYGNSVVYFLDPYVGPCQLTNGGVVKAIFGLKKTWKRVNVKATGAVCCGTFYPRKQQILWWVAVDGGNTPTLGIRIQTNELRDDGEGFLRRGISLITGNAAAALCATTLLTTVSNLTTEIPFIGRPTPDFVQQMDSGTDDNGTAYTATVTGRPFFTTGLMTIWGAMKAALLATADSLGSIKIALIRDEGVETLQSAATSLAPVGSEVQVTKLFDALTISEATSLQVSLTDGAAGAPWQVQRVDFQPVSGGPLGAEAV